MRPHVVDIRDFYQSHLGQVARLMVRRRLRELWPDVRQQSLLGIGYATPYLAAFRDEAERVAAVMPAAQGVVHWPQRERGLVALGDELDLPFADQSFDRILLVHELENTEQVGQLLRELWRVLTAGGRLLAVVPNRRGLWAQAERTPYGQGRPFSPGQLTRLLHDNMFQPTERQTALYVPPIRNRMFLRTAGVWERFGATLGTAFAGVLLVEASKQLYALTPARATRRRRFAPVVLPGRAVGVGAARDSEPRPPVA